MRLMRKKIPWFTIQKEANFHFGALGDRTSLVGLVISAFSSWTQHHQPSRRIQSRPHNGRNTYATISLCGWHSVVGGFRESRKWNSKGFVEWWNEAKVSEKRGRRIKWYCNFEKRIKVLIEIVILNNQIDRLLKNNVLRKIWKILEKDKDDSLRRENLVIR